MASTEERTRNIPHQVIMENRRDLSVSGVSDVDSFDGETVVAYTDMGALTIKGHDLQIKRLNVESGDLSLTGEIDSLIYTSCTEKHGRLGRLFR